MSRRDQSHSEENLAAHGVERCRPERVVTCLLGLGQRVPPRLRVRRYERRRRGRCVLARALSRLASGRLLVPPGVLHVRRRRQVLGCVAALEERV